MIAYVIVLLVVAAAVYVVSSPLRAARRETLADERAVEIAELEAARDAKYREIRDAELDHQTGKLTDEDHRALDGLLRAEAVDILHRLDRARGGDTGAAPDPAAVS